MCGVWCDAQHEWRLKQPQAHEAHWNSMLLQFMCNAGSSIAASQGHSSPCACVLWARCLTYTQQLAGAMTAYSPTAKLLPQLRPGPPAHACPRKSCWDKCNAMCAPPPRTLLASTLLIRAACTPTMGSIVRLPPEHSSAYRQQHAACLQHRMPSSRWTCSPAIVCCGGGSAMARITSAVLAASQSARSSACTPQQTTEHTHHARHINSQTEGKAVDVGTHASFPLPSVLQTRWAAQFQADHLCLYMLRYMITEC